MPPGPGGLGEFEQLPPEVRRLVIEAMPPESLQRFSEASASLKQEVDLYVKDLVRDEILRDLTNRPVKELVGFDPDKTLADWVNGRYQTDLWSSRLHPITLEGVAVKYNFFTKVAAGFQAYALGEYDKAMQKGGEAGLQVRAELEVLAHQMAMNGQVETIGEVPTIVDRTTPPSVVLDGIRGGKMRFITP